METAAAASARPKTSEGGLRLAGMNLRAFEIFVDVAECGSMTAAAERLGVSQSAVSQAIRAFELALGQTLFDRALRPPALTLAGRAVLQHATDIVRHARSLERAGGGAGGQALPLLRIGMANTFAVTVAPFLLEQVRHLAQRWTITSGPAETRIDGLLDRRVDLIVTFDEAPARREFFSLKIMSEPYCIAVPRSFRGDVSSWTDLTGAMDMLRYGRHLHVDAQTEAYLDREGIEAPSHYRFDTIDAVIAMVAAGIGWALVSPLGVLKSAALAPRLRFFRLPGPELRRTLVIAGRPDDGGEIVPLLQRAAIRALSEHCLPELRRLLPGIGEAVQVSE